MTDTATPTPNDTADHIAQQVANIAAFAREWGEAVEASAARWQAHSMMPTLTVRDVLAGGYVAHKEA